MQPNNDAPRRASISESLLKVFAVALTIAFCLAMLEVGLRVVGRYPGNSAEGYYALGKTCYRLKKNFSQTIHWPATSFTVNTDDMGFRFKRTESRKIQDRHYYAVLGSSDVFGMGLDYEKTFVGVLGERLEHDGIQVLNMAVAGHALDVQSDMFREFSATVSASPMKVLICLNPRVISEFDDWHTNVVLRMGYLFGKSGWRTALAKRVLENKSTAYCFFRDAFRKMQMACCNTKDFDVEYYFDTYSAAGKIRSPERSREFLEHLKQLENYIRKLGATPVCVYCPTTGGFLMNKLKADGKLKNMELDTSFFPDLVRAHCDAEGVQFINVEPDLQKLFDDGKTLNIRLDGHFNALTSRVIGEILHQELKPDSSNLRAGSSHGVAKGSGLGQ